MEYEEIKRRASKFNTRTEFYVGDRYAYLQARKKGVQDDVCSHMKNPVYIQWTKEKCREVALSCKDWTEFITLHHRAYSAAQRHNWIPYVCKDIPRAYPNSYFNLIANDKRAI